MEKYWCLLVANDVFLSITHCTVRRIVVIRSLMTGKLCNIQVQLHANEMYSCPQEFQYAHTHTHIVVTGSDFQLLFSCMYPCESLTFKKKKKKNTKEYQ